MKALVLALLPAATLLGSAGIPPAPDVETIVRAAAERQRAGERRGTPLVFDHVDVMTERDARGRPKGVERHVYVSLSRGRGIESRELVEVDGRAPSERERRSVRDEDAKRRRDRADRPAGDDGEDADLRSGRLPLADLLTRFDFRFVREEMCEGRLAYLVAFGPREGRAPKTLRDRVLDEFAGHAWIDVAELEAIRIEGRLTRTVKVAGGLALELRRVEITYEGLPVAPGLWQPCVEELRVDARAALVIPYRRDIRFEFSNYRAATGVVSAAGTRQPTRAE